MKFIIWDDDKKIYYKLQHPMTIQKNKHWYAENTSDVRGIFKTILREIFLSLNVLFKRYKITYCSIIRASNRWNNLSVEFEWYTLYILGSFTAT